MKRDAWQDLIRLARKMPAEQQASAESEISPALHMRILAATRRATAPGFDGGNLIFLLRKAVALGAIMLALSIAFFLIAPNEPTMDGWVYATTRLSETLVP